MKKRIFASLLALVMAFSLLPASALAANATVKITEGSGTDYGANTHSVTLKQGTPAGTVYYGQNSNGGTISKSVDESGIYKVLPVYPYGRYHYTPTDYMVTADSVTVDQEGIIGDLSISLVQGIDSDRHRHQCIQFGFTALRAGTVTVTLKYYYNFGLPNVDTKWYLGTATCKIKVTGSSAVKPNKPTEKDIARFAGDVGNVSGVSVALFCDSGEEDHTSLYTISNDGNHNLDYWGHYTLGDVVENPGTLGINTTNYPYVCPMTIDASGFLVLYNSAYESEVGTHALAAGQGNPVVYWFWDKTDKIWKYKRSDAPVELKITCKQEPDAGQLDTAIAAVEVQVACASETTHTPAKYPIGSNAKIEKQVNGGTATITLTAPADYASLYQAGGKTHTYDEKNTGNRLTFTMEWKKGADGWNWYLKGEPALIMTKCTPVPTEDDVKKALDGLEKGVQVTCVTEKNNHGSKTYAVKLGLPENWGLGEKVDWHGHIGYEVEAPTSSFVNLFSSEHGKHTVKDGMPETLRWVIYWDGSSWKADAHDNPAEIEVEHVNAPDTYQVTVKNSAATNSGAGFYEADKTVTIRAGSRSNYTFIGWTTSSGVTFANAAKADTTFKMPAKAVEVTANWRYTGSDSDNDKDDDYTLKYVTNGGKVISSETKSRSWVKDYEDLPTPTRSGYRFEGWYYDTRLTDKVTDDVKVNKTVVTLYARWSSSETPGMLNDEDHFAYVQGYSDGNVHPYGLISRAETTTIFFRLLTDEVRDDNLLTSNTYTDVTNDYWANTAISTMTGLGIVQGRSATTFDPKAPITRAQFAAICARFDTGVSSGSRTFSDISGHWAEKYIERAAELGWIQGFADGTFRPDTYITRAQAMTMINRVLNRTPEDEEDLLKGMKVWPDCNPGDWFYLAVQEATNSHDYKDRGGEVWTKLTRDPDWTRYER